MTLHPFFTLSLMAISVHAYAGALQMPMMFSDNMVLQRNQADPVWGTASPGQKVTVRFLDRNYQTTALPSGKWMLKLPVQKAGGPYTLQVKSGDESLEFKNVLVGEVWVCSGQSNMDMSVGTSNNRYEEMAAAKYPEIRLLRVEPTANNNKITGCKIAGGEWRECTPETIKEFSAVAYFYARSIYQKTGIPIGLIHSAIGGSSADLWIPSDSITALKQFAPVDFSLAREKFKTQMAAWEKAVEARDRGFQEGRPNWASPNLNLELWPWVGVKLPMFWGSLNPNTFTGITPSAFSGVIWCGKDIKLPNELLGQDLTVNLGKVYGDLTVYWNGTKLTALPRKTQESDLVCPVPANLLDEHENRLAVRILGYEYGGFLGKAEDMKISADSGASLSVAGNWQCRKGCELFDLRKPVEPRTFNRDFYPGILYEYMITPLIPYGIRGAIWYQGEANTGQASTYTDQLSLLIQSWREKWGQGEFPFYYMQLPIYGDHEDTQATGSDWAELRDAQRQALSVPNTGMAVTIDFNDPGLHPRNKQDFGLRLSLIPLAKLYGKKIDCEGPFYKGYKIEGKTIRIFFSNPKVGLKSRDGEALKGFVMAGEDHVFYLADAKIEGNSVVVSCKKVSKPVAVRYAWSHWPMNNLTSAAGLPACPFRTDKWKWVTEN